MLVSDHNLALTDYYVCIMEHGVFNELRLFPFGIWQWLTPSVFRARRKSNSAELELDLQSPLRRFQPVFVHEWWILQNDRQEHDDIFWICWGTLLLDNLQHKEISVASSLLFLLLPLVRGAVGEEKMECLKSSSLFSSLHIYEEVWRNKRRQEDIKRYGPGLYFP